MNNRVILEFWCPSMPMPSETAGNRPKQEDGQSIRAKDKPEQTFSLMIWSVLP